MATPGIAAGAYARLARITDPAGSLNKTIGEAKGADGQNFGSVLKDVVTSITEAGRKSDTQSQALAAGKANIVDVVTAVAETETAISTLVSVRDKVIAAYEEIMRMQI
jgi:flagellar hook-basal body complex protein FliE